MVTENFERSEFECGCGCGFDTVDVALARILQKLRTFYDAPVRINSACRCVEYNKKEGGAKRSLHLYGKAADVTVDGVSPQDVANRLEIILMVVNQGNGGIGRYHTFTHVDCRDSYVRWGLDE